MTIWLLSLGLFAFAVSFLGLALYKGWQRRIFEPTGKMLMFCAASLAVFITFSILASLLFETLLFFDKVSFSEFFLSTHWSPQTSIREDQIAAEGSFGLIPVLWGTLFITFIALFISIPLGIFTAIFLFEYAPKKIRSALKSMLELLAGIPSVVYGFIAIIDIGPRVRFIGESIGLPASSDSALAAGLVMGIMILPMVCSLTDDALRSVPTSLRDASLGLGSTPDEALRKVLFPAALPGIAGGVILAFSRAISETMIVVMAAGLIAKITINPFESVTTMSVQIVTLLTGDQTFDSAKTLAAYALGTCLFFLTLLLNFIALKIVHKYREKYQ